MPTIGKAFGQTKAGAMSPGLDFAFGLIGDSYIEKARDNGWLLQSDSVATPATTNKFEDLQLRATLEPVKDLKIDLTASRTQNTGRSIQYKYQGNPTSINGTFNMTTLSIKSAFEEAWRQRRQRLPFAHVREVLLVARRFPRACRGTLRRLRLSRRNPVCRQNVRREERRSEQVQQRRDGAGIPRRLHEHGKRAALHLPTLSKLLPNWTVRYSGLSNCRGCATNSRASISTTLTRASIPSVHTVRTAPSWST